MKAAKVLAYVTTEGFIWRIVILQMKR